MRKKATTPDYKTMASDFKVGDTVAMVSPITLEPFSYIGTVTAVLPAIGCVDVQFPHEHTRVTADQIVHMIGRGPEFDNGPDTWDRRHSEDPVKVASRYARRFAGVLEVAANFRHAGVAEMDAYHMIARRFAGTHADAEVRDAVHNAYHGKTALYWKEKGRKYCPSKTELAEGKFYCPKCNEVLGQTVYKKETKLYACRTCLFLIKPADILAAAAQAEDSEPTRETLRFVVSDPSKSFNEWL